MDKNTVAGVLRCMLITIVGLIMVLIIAVNTINEREAQIEEMAERIRILEQTTEQEPESTTEPKPESTSKQTDMEYIGEFKCTAYCTEKYEHICGTGYGITASGQPVQAGTTIAVGDTDRFPYGTVLYIEGIGTRIVQDTGGGLADNQIDLALGTHEEALNWGCRNGVKVYIVKGGGAE